MTRLRGRCVRLTFTSEIRDIPTRALKAKRCRSHLLFIGILTALRAGHQQRVRHLLQHILRMTAGATTISIDRHSKVLKNYLNST